MYSSEDFEKFSINSHFLTAYIKNIKKGLEF